MSFKSIVVGAVTIAGLTVSIPAWAQNGVINLDETVIKGRIQKPEAFYILQHANLSYEKLTPKQSFMPELLKSVEAEPF
ncbi:MAG: hypothetical protein R3E66_20775 [bacterium]